MKMENEKYYIAVNAGDRYPLLKTPQDYTEYFNEALSFGDLFDVLAVHLGVVPSFEPFG